VSAGQHADASTSASLRSRSTLRAILVAYAIISVLWIFGSDTAVSWLVTDPEIIATISLVKGITFVFCTTLLFSWLLNRVASEDSALDSAGEQAPRKARYADGAAIVAATLVGLVVVHIAWPKQLGSTPMHRVVAWLLVVVTIGSIALFAQWVLRQGAQLTAAIRERDEARVHLQTLKAIEAHRDELQELVRRRTSELEAERDRAEQANEAKSAFVASVSHEIRTPLNTIVGLAYMLKQSKLRGADESRAARIDEAAKHLLSLVDSVLDLAQIEAGKFSLAAEDFSLSAVLEAVRTIVAPAAEAKGLSLEFSCEVSAVLRGDATRLRQVLLNLTGNAVKYTRKGYVRLRARCENHEQKSAEVVIEVEDSGPGISPLMLERIFAPFERGLSVNESNEGTGLGLYIARQIIEQMGGSIRARSEVGVGSTFTVTVPFEAVSAADKPLEQPRAAGALETLRAQHAGAKVLVLDDQVIHRDVTCALLKSAGIDARGSSDPKEAIAQLSREEFSLLLLDLQFEDTDGASVARMLRAAPSTASLPIIAVSAAAFEEDRRACLAAGMNDFIAKPIDPPTLFETILRQLERAPASGARIAHEPTLDAERGVASFAGQAAMYANAAAKFIESYSPGHSERDALTDGSPLVAGRAAHRLRGVAGTLGGRAILAIAQRYERALRSGERPDPAPLLRALDELRTALSRAIVVISERLEPRSKRGTPALDHGLDLLRARLLARDFEAATQCRALQDALRERFGPAARALVESVENFDYPKALALLDELRAGRAPVTQDQASR
jgi:signal transduction histidine kinase/HPt (histidine-containing phosphotransfer) domain-containing protein